MGKILNFTRHHTTPEDRVMTVAARLGQGPKAPVEMSLAAIMRWDRAADVEVAAIHIVGLPSHGHAVDWWTGHIIRFTERLIARGLRQDRVDELRAQYTGAVREEIKRIRALRLTAEQWNAHALIGVFGMPSSELDGEMRETK